MEEEKVRQNSDTLQAPLDSAERNSHIELKEINSNPDDIKKESTGNQEVSNPESSSRNKQEAFPDLGLNYEVLEYIGDGGMGAVYKVKDRELKSIVAIKILKQELVSDKAALKRFEQESQSLSELNHPNLVTVYGSGQTNDGTPFIVMDYLEGKDLATILKRESTLELNRVINIAEQICQGLSHAHKNGIVHRDIKPSNILITNDGGKDSVKILDFGIARIVESTMGNTTNLTQTGEVFGTPTYMSPEQCETGEIDKRSDIYSIGCVVYEMLIGKPPFQGTNPIQVAVKHINDEPEKFPKKLLKSKNMKSMESIVLNCLSKEADHRYKSTDLLRADLAKLLKGIRVDRFLIGNKESRPKWLLNCCKAAIILSFYAICGVTMVQVGDFIISNHSANSISTFACSFFVVINFFGTIMFPLCTKYDLRNVKAVNAKVSHFWDLGETASISFLLWLGVILYSAPLVMDVNSGLTGLIASMLGFLFIAGTLVFSVNACLAAIYSLKIFKKWNKPLSRKLLVKQWIAACGAAIIFTIPFAIFLPKALSCVPLALGTMITAPAPQFATKLVDLSLALNSNNKYAVMQKAYLETELGNKDKAIATANKSVELNPNSSRALYARAKVFRYVGNSKAAVKDLTKLIKLEPKEANYYKEKAHLELDLKQYKSAIADFTELIKLNPQNGSNYRKRALLYALENNFDGANADMERALISGSTYNTGQDFLRIAMINDLAGNKDKAREYFQKAIDESSDYSHDVKAYAYKQLGKTKEFEKETKMRNNRESQTNYIKSTILFDIDFPLK